MQTYGYRLSLFGTSSYDSAPDVYAYWPIIGVDSQGRNIDVTKKYRYHQKRRLGVSFGSGPYWHHKCLMQLQNTVAPKTVDLISGTFFTETRFTRPEKFNLAIKLDETVTYCSVSPSGPGRIRVLLSQMRPQLMDRRNMIIQWRMFSVYEYEYYSSIAHTQEVLESYLSKYEKALFRKPWSVFFESTNRPDLLSGVSYDVDFSKLIDTTPAPADFETDWENISLFGVPSGRTAQFSQRAFEIAAADLPKADVNALANTMETAQAIRKVILSDITAILPKGRTFSKAMTGTWLAYRYAICTTKFDVDSYKNYIRRIQSLSEYRVIRCRSVVVDPDTHDIYRASLTFKVSSLPADLNSRLEKLGFQLDLVNAWDMVPYSFIIDWFANISDILEVLDQKSFSSTIDPVESWASRESADHTTYIRWATKWMPSFPLLLLKDVSKKTLFMRVADAISLLAQR